MIEPIAKKMMDISVKFYGDTNSMLDESLLNNHIISLKNLKKEAERCSGSIRRNEIIAILEKAQKGLDKHLEKIKGI